MRILLSNVLALVCFSLCLGAHSFHQYVQKGVHCKTVCVLHRQHPIHLFMSLNCLLFLLSMTLLQAVSFAICPKDHIVHTLLYNVINKYMPIYAFILHTAQFVVDFTI